MPGYFRGVAIDYDGTLTDTGRPEDDVLAVLRELRGQGYKLVLVTGRIVEELREELRTVFPDCAGYCDLIVAENGAVVAAGSLIRCGCCQRSPVRQRSGGPHRRRAKWRRRCGPSSGRDAPR